MILILNRHKRIEYFIHKVHKIYLHRYVNQVYFTPNIPKQLNEI